jgi:integrase
MGVPGQVLLCASSFVGSPARQGFAAGSRHTSYAMLTQSSSPREGVPLNIIQRQLDHANLGTTSVYLQGIDTEEIISAVHTRRAPMMSATAGLCL